MSSTHVPVGALSRFFLTLLLLTAIPCTVALGQSTTFRVVILGSSTAQGANASPLSESWASLYAAQLASAIPGSQVVNLALGGYSTFNVMPTGYVPPSTWNTSGNQPAAGRNITAALSYNPDLIIINLPTNDADIHVPVDQQMANYQVIIAAAAAQHVPVWVTTPQPRTTLDGPGHLLLSAMVPATYDAFQERTVDFWTGLGDANGNILAAYNSDGTHLNNAGHAVLFDRINLTVSTAAGTLPAIAMHPRSRSVYESDTTSFSVIAYDTVALTYRWQRNGTDIPGESSARFAIAHAALSDSGALYRCIVSNGITHDTSAAVALIVRALPTGGTGIVSDDFSGGTLNGSLWSAVNPLGDATFGITGSGTPDARLTITVPAGVTHDLWVGAVTAPRLLQAVPNADLSVEAKFDGTMGAEYQTQGIIALQDASTFVRFDFVRDATKTRFFAASFSGGTPTVRKDTAIAGGAPLYLRVTRSANSWTGAFSTDGTTWRTAVTFSATLTLTGIGPFAGNAGGAPPAFTSQIDYFFNTASPIIPEDGSVTQVQPGITLQPLSQSVVAGQPVTFTVGASGSDPLSYQWQRNTVTIPGATSPSYTITAATLADSGAGFRCVVTNGMGNATSTAAVLTVTQPIVSSGLVSDDFSGPSINTSLWTVVNPLGDATFSLTGTGSQDARLAISVPAGASHDLWTGGFNAPRILQSIPNTDFSLDVRFESILASQYQMQGIIIQQDASNLIRFDIVKDASSTRFFAATFSGGSAVVRKDTAIAATGSIFLRVRRQGSAWTGSYSFDGTSWVTAAAFSQALTVTAAGPFAGNHGIPATASPAFTALVDYVFNTGSPITPEDGPAVQVIATVLTDPAGVTVNAGQPATFTITASGSTPLTYAWQRNGVTIPSASAASYTLSATTSADSGALFRCIARNAVGADTSASALLRVTTPPSGVTSDNFNAAALNSSLWSFVDPLGDASVSLTGSQVRIAIPAGAGHDLWTGANHAPRLLQTVPDADLSVEAKFDAVMTSEYQTAGIIAVQDASTFIRFDFVRDAANTRFFSASFSGGTPTVRKDTIIATGAPLYLRVQRTGSTWTGSFSTNGTTWRAAVVFSAPMTLTAIGPFAGTAGSAPPAFNALIDYFFNTAAPLAARAGGIATTAATAAPELPSAFALLQNYPNPFNPNSEIRYQISEFRIAKLAVYDVLGHEVAVLVNEPKMPGEYQVKFDATGLPSGVYFYRLQAGAFTETKRMALVR
jgi:lysophospholipase L1-like esterase